LYLSLTLLSLTFTLLERREKEKAFAFAIVSELFIACFFVCFPRKLLYFTNWTSFSFLGMFVCTVIWDYLSPCCLIQRSHHHHHQNPILVAKTGVYYLSSPFIFWFFFFLGLLFILLRYRGCEIWICSYGLGKLCGFWSGFEAGAK